nr:reverse transcriptase domain-containing protein [Tanacetum cinerariifolium]
MRTRSSSNLPIESPPNPSSSNPKRHNHRRSKQPFILEESLVDTMVDQRTMAELLQAARRWLKKEPPCSILTWEYLVSKFINEFFPPSITTNLRNEISNFQQRFDESFHKAWDRYKDLLCACPHHGFTELYQLDTFYNALNPSDQDSLNSAADGNLLERRTQDVLTTIEKNQSQPQGYNRSNNFNPEQSYQALTQQNQVVPLRSGSLPSNTIANPKGKLKVITTQSGIVLDGP